MSQDNTEVNLKENELDPKALFAQLNKKSHDVSYIVRADTHGSLEVLICSVKGIGPYLFHRL